jgi:hypothetical protein
LDQAGSAKSADSQKYEMARRTVLKKYFGDTYEPQQKFADPSALFGE